ncbi:glutathione S-transferase N-terminal domain-containing protein [Massilia agri]|uniref:Glutathione S-transferase N-terminal domain-containing protein n=1 Tax=Massilia agri TaxID=1886785 RepID=A0ABT2AEZ7_9BURK|nr:glutathione S-transferase N-terminal domain-containing protein [Massilia agri]MCS0594751.1 glutathione S-transferase N-terminal domain-containing protein [Massilia agri]
MEPLLFYGVPSGCSLASIIALEWLGQPYRLCRIEMLEHPWPERYARVNPRQKTPALLLDADTGLTESAAILQHIAGRGIDIGLGARQGTLEFDRLAEMLAYLTTDFFASFAPLWKAYETEGLGETEKRRMFDEGKAAVVKEFGHVENMLAGRSWLLGGEAPGVADAYLFAVARWADYHRLFDVEARFPAIAQHAARLRQMPPVRFALAIEAGEAARSESFRGHVPIEEALAS